MPPRPAEIVPEVLTVTRCPRPVALIAAADEDALIEFTETSTLPVPVDIA